jgi:hypothetical protein
MPDQVPSIRRSQGQSPQDGVGRAALKKAVTSRTKLTNPTHAILEWEGRPGTQMRPAPVPRLFSHTDQLFRRFLDRAFLREKSTAINVARDACSAFDLSQHRTCRSVSLLQNRHDEKLSSGQLPCCAMTRRTRPNGSREAGLER